MAAGTALMLIAVSSLVGLPPAPGLVGLAAARGATGFWSGIAALIELTPRLVATIALPPDWPIATLMPVTSTAERPSASLASPLVRTRAAIPLVTAIAVRALVAFTFVTSAAVRALATLTLVTSRAIGALTALTLVATTPG